MKREEILAALAERIADKGSPMAIYTHGDIEVIKNQIVIMEALSYLVEHITEQAWRNRPLPTSDTTGETV